MVTAIQVGFSKGLKTLVSTRKYCNYSGFHFCYPTMFEKAKPSVKRAAYQKAIF
jgi:hypothetical protein